MMGMLVVPFLSGTPLPSPVSLYHPSALILMPLLLEPSTFLSYLCISLIPALLLVRNYDPYSLPSLALSLSWVISTLTILYGVAILVMGLLRCWWILLTMKTFASSMMVRRRVGFTLIRIPCPLSTCPYPPLLFIPKFPGRLYHLPTAVIIILSSSHSFKIPRHLPLQSLHLKSINSAIQTGILMLHPLITC